MTPQIYDTSVAYALYVRYDFLRRLYVRAYAYNALGEHVRSTCTFFCRAHVLKYKYLVQYSDYIAVVLVL